MNKLKILMIAPTPFFSDRGCHVRIYEEIKIIKKLGHKVTLVTYHLGRNLKNINIKRTINIPWYNKLSAGPSYHKIYLDIFLFFKCIKMLIKEKYDIIYTHLHEGAFIGEILKLFFRKKVIFDAQGSLTAEMKAHGYLKFRLMHKLFYFLEKIITKNADMIITSSENTHKLIKKKFGVDQIVTIADGVDTKEFNPKNIDKELKKKLGLKNKKIIVYLGGLNKYQGIGMLLKTAKEVLKKKDVMFLIMGYPVGGYEEKAKELGIKKNVIFTGKINYKKAAQYLNLGDIAVSFKVSETEANGKLYNYIACGLPSIVTDTPLNKEILGDLGMYIKNNDFKAAAKKIVNLIDDKKRLKELSKKGLNKAKKMFSWESKGKKIDDTLEKTKSN